MHYSQLNTLTCYQFGQSTLLPKPYAKRAKELGYEAIGFCDENLYSFPSFTDACLQEGLKPVYGYRIRINSPSTHPIDACLYIKSEEGYLNLCSLYRNRKAVYSYEDLQNIHEGLCLVIDTENPDFKDKEFLTIVSPLLFRLHAIFKEDFYLGIVISSKEDKENIDVLYDYCSTSSYPSIPFCKACYLKKTDAYKTNLLSVGMRWTEMSEEEREKSQNIEKEGPYFLLSKSVIESLYRKEDIETLETFVCKIDFTFFKKRGHLVKFENDDEKLSEETHAVLNAKFNGQVPEEYSARLNHELNVIQSMAFSSYFLLVADYVSYAKKSDIIVAPGRGSAGGSLVSYLLNITETDPIRYRLSFERFLNPMRKNMPDIDVDIEAERRNEVVEYLKNKYGEKKVSCIITFSTLKPRSALGLIGPVLNVSEARLKRLTNTIDGKSKNFKEALSSYRGKQLKRLLEDPYYKNICDIAESLLGMPVNTSFHAPGIIISQEDIAKAVPMSEGDKGIALYEFPYMERLGYLKCDLLSAIGLSFLKKVEARLSVKPDDIQNHLDDEQTYKTLNSLALAEIYQLGSEGMHDTVALIQPSCFGDLASILALYRPGPKSYIPVYARRKKGQEKVIYKTELLRPVLEDTYGIMVYQEEVMEALKTVAGFSDSDADFFRSAISKKKKEVMDKYQVKFMEGCKENGLSEETSLSIYNDIEKFSDYGFNKSHAYSYALVVFRFLYYKAHYPVEFYQTAIENTSLNSDSFADIKKELEQSHIRVVAPDINHSLAFETLFKKDRAYISLSRAAILDSEVLASLVLEREKNGQYKTIYDFLTRNKSLLEEKHIRELNGLIDCGAFDSLNHNRSGIKEMLPTYLGFAKMGFKEEDISDIPNTKEDLGERLLNEKSSLKIILSEKISSVVSKDGYITMIVSDDSQLEMNHRIHAITETNDYIIDIKDNQNYKKGDFIFVQGNFSLSSKKLFDCTLINSGKKAR